MTDRITSFIGTCSGAIIGFFQIDIMPMILKVPTFHMPEECKTLLMAFGGGVMAWIGGRMCTWTNRQFKAIGDRVYSWKNKHFKSKSDE